MPRRALPLPAARQLQPLLPLRCSRAMPGHGLCPPAAASGAK